MLVPHNCFCLDMTQAGEGPKTSTMLPFSRYPTLRTYLRSIRDVVFQKTSNGPAGAAAPRLTLVMGNPSADLDSFISAIVFSYFHNHATKTTDNIFIPLLNMPKTPSTELWRLRPEFGVALRQASTASTDASSAESAEQQAKDLLDNTITIKDLLDSSSTRPELKRVFKPDGTRVKQPIILVDHNAPSITVPHVASSTITDQLEITGCIDHHIEENVVTHQANPRIITTGIGSCTTLVVNHLRQTSTWPKTLDDPQTSAIRELALLALAPILIDTHNLKASGEKCSDLDRAIVATLEIELGSSASLYGVKSTWNRDAFYDPITEAKVSSLDLLTPQEMFERDYKSWTEGRIEIGIASLVRPLPWLSSHAGGTEQLAAELRTFATQMHAEQTVEGVRFDVVMLLTPGARDKGKEIVMVTFSDEAARAIDDFEGRSESLGLQAWDGDGVDDVTRSFESAFGAGRFRIWWMTQREKTRKQGAPLVREAVAAVQRG